MHETSIAYTPQQNGVAEMKNKTLVKIVNAMLLNSNLSKGYEGEAMLTARHLLNRVLTKNLKVTPYLLWFKRKPNLGYLKVWSCRDMVRLP